VSECNHKVSSQSSAQKRGASHFLQLDNGAGWIQDQRVSGHSPHEPERRSPDRLVDARLGTSRSGDRAPIFRRFMVESANCFANSHPAAVAAGGEGESYSNFAITREEHNRFAATVRAWLAGRHTHIAILRCNPRIHGGGFGVRGTPPRKPLFVFQEVSDSSSVFSFRPCANSLPLLYLFFTHFGEEASVALLSFLTPVLGARREMHSDEEG